MKEDFGLLEQQPIGDVQLDGVKGIKRVELHDYLEQDLLKVLQKIQEYHELENGVKYTGRVLKSFSDILPTAIKGWKDQLRKASSDALEIVFPITEWSTAPASVTNDIVYEMARNDHEL